MSSSSTYAVVTNSVISIHGQEQYDTFKSVYRKQLLDDAQADDFTMEELRIFNKVMNFIETASPSPEKLKEWQIEFGEVLEQEAIQRQREANEEPSPYDTDNFMMDLSDVATAEPIPALFNLPDRNGKPQLFMPR